MPTQVTRRFASPFRSLLRNTQRSVGLVAALFVVLVGLSGCANSNEGFDATNAVTRDAGGLSSTEVTQSDESTGFPTGTVVAVEEAAVPEAQVDFLGNAVTVHGWSRWPAVLESGDPFADSESALFGTLDFGRTPGTSIVAVDIEVCAANDQAPDVEMFRSRFQLVDGNGVAHRGDEADLRASMIFQPVVLPKLSWPSGGQCQRGWQGLEWRIGEDPAGAQYTAVSMAESTFGDLHVYRWRLDDASHDATPISVGAGNQNEQLAVDAGKFSGFAMTLKGWNEVADTSTERDVLNRQYVQPSEGHRLVAALIELCAPVGAAETALPDFGLQIEGWNLLAPLRTTEVWGPGYVPLAAPSDGNCTAGWVPFDVPLDTTVTGVFVTDRYDPGAPWLEWNAGDQLPPPDVGVGFPNQLLTDTIADLCDADAALSMLLAGTEEPQDFSVASAVAVKETDSRVSIYLGQQTINPADIPTPTTPGARVLKLVAENATDTDLIASEYRDDGSNGLYGSIAMLDADQPGRFVAFLGATVAIDEINDDYLCGTLTNSGDEPSIGGRFGAPIWRP